MNDLHKFTTSKFSAVLVIHLYYLVYSEESDCKIHISSAFDFDDIDDDYSWEKENEFYNNERDQGSEKDLLVLGSDSIDETLKHISILKSSQSNQSWY